MTDKITMGQIWEELEPLEREIISKMIGIPMGQLALMKLSAVFKAVAYRYHDKSDLHTAQIASEYKRVHAEIQRQYELAEARRQRSMPTIASSTGTGIGTGNVPYWILDYLK